MYFNKSTKCCSECALIIILKNFSASFSLVSSIFQRTMSKSLIISVKSSIASPIATPGSETKSSGSKICRYQPKSGKLDSTLLLITSYSNVGSFSLSRRASSSSYDAVKKLRYISTNNTFRRKLLSVKLGFVPKAVISSIVFCRVLMRKTKKDLSICHIRSRSSKTSPKSLCLFRFIKCFINENNGNQ